MLTKGDLQKIGGVVDEKLKREVKPIKKEQMRQGKDIKYLRKTLDLAIDHLIIAV